MKNENSIQLLISILNYFTIIVFFLFATSGIVMIIQLIQLLDLNWINNSYFAKITTFNWNRFLGQFTLLQAIFILLYMVLAYLPIMLWEHVPSLIKRNLKPITVLYFATTLTLTLSITMSEGVFVITTSIVAFVALIHPAFARLIDKL
ncbi:hypothetical protein [Streptococcus equinus]|uniref:Uncharacterized protein n=3 Tax=Streptococcus equinus TaxID=1335 RepID=A0A091BSA2_STREI|nr:hypothetical protein [Streptococcus equinus]KFN87604.1 hypothetical protein H702_06935 [Streptococcus equinus JB1]QBX15747.1 hypothetical protein Javan207_0061 [Streptococcus phage Javan207]SDW27410.1 hypothetical protein SAMN05216415_0362 [Streptococcus equinus]SFL16679.1 hypothetical protein SAMN02910290_00735 [Streptococcus equinus JB1]